jgi:hypothetical protein
MCRLAVRPAAARACGFIGTGFIRIVLVAGVGLLVRKDQNICSCTIKPGLLDGLSDLVSEPRTPTNAESVPSEIDSALAWSLGYARSTWEQSSPTSNVRSRVLRFLTQSPVT